MTECFLFSANKRNGTTASLGTQMCFNCVTVVSSTWLPQHFRGYNVVVAIELLPGGAVSTDLTARRLRAGGQINTGTEPNEYGVKLLPQI